MSMETSTAAPPDGRPVVGALKKNSLGTGGITFLDVSAAAPLTVIAGTVPLAILIGGAAGPLAYLVVGLALAVFAVGADLTVLAGDPLAVSPEELAELPVLATIVGGEVRHLV